MRDGLIHSYFGIDYKLVWTTIKDSLPKTKILLNKILEDRKPTN